MNKKNNPKLLNTVIQGTGMKLPRVPNVILGSQLNGYVQGDLMDANAVLELITQTEGISREELNEAIERIIGMAPDNLNSLEELANALNNDPEFLSKLISDIELLKQAEAEESASIEDELLTINI